MTQIRIDDVLLHFRDVGHGPPLLLVHGLGGSLTDWDAQIAFFSPQYRVIAPDLRGFGRTGRGRQRIGLRRFVADLVQLLIHLRIDEPVLLVGHSMGGAVAAQFAVDHPQRVKRLVIANSLPSFKPRAARHYVEFFFRLGVMTALGPSRMAAIGARRMFPNPDQQAMRDKLMARGRANTRRAYLSALFSMGQWSVMERLAELKMPVLIIGAEHDYFAREDTERFLEVLPEAKIQWFAGAHHGLPMEQPEAFNAALQAFFDAGEASAAGTRKANAPRAA